MRRFPLTLAIAVLLVFLASPVGHAATKKSSSRARSSAVSIKKSPVSCVIKGNISTKREKIYHLPGCASYNATKIDVSKGERMFCTEAEARAAGWRKAKNCY